MILSNSYIILAIKTTEEEVTVYGYNELNQLTQLTNTSGTTTYTYNLSGLRETKSNGGNTTKYYYDGQNVIIETINNNFSARNIFGINPIARENNNSTLYYLYNGHADVVAMVDNSGNAINSYDYDIYGNIKEANELGIENPIRYAGQYYDDESDLYYLRARYYDPGLMRFISEDTNKGDVKDPLSLNLYVYCMGNPLRYYDPSGNLPIETIFDIVSIGTSAVDFIKNPSWVNAGFLIWDIGAAVIPYAPGSYIAKGVKYAEKVDDTVDILKGTSKGKHFLLEEGKDLADYNIIPKFRGNSKKYADFIAKRGIDVDMFAITLSHGKDSHHLKFIHGQGKWNQLWMEWIDNNPNATEKDIFQFAGKLMDEFGLSTMDIHPYLE